MSFNLWRKSSQTDMARPSLGLADLAVGLGVLTLLYVVAKVGAQSLVQFSPPDVIPTVDLDPRNLPNYAARSTLRMFVALGFSTHLHLCLWLRRRAQQASRAGAGAAAGHSAIDPRPGISVGHGDGLHRAVSRQPARPGSRVHLRDLHRPGMEHDVLVLPVAALGAAGTGRNGRRCTGCPGGSASRGWNCRHRSSAWCGTA